MEIEFNDKLAFLFEPARLKIGFGGRGAGKTDGYAIALIIFAMKMRLRILCLREIQNSIEESVKSTIESYIEHYGLEWAFDVKDKYILCTLTGSKFLFSGLRHKINAIKSLAKIDIAWLEEANNTSKSSLDKLMPTIRGKHESSKDGLGGPFKMGPEVWISFNPELDDDEVYDRYVVKKDLYAPDYLPNEVTGEMERYAYVVKINYTDNKWFPPDLRREMNLLKVNNPTKYLEVWEGFTKQTLDGAIYADELKQTLLDGRRGKVLYDPTKPVFTFWDLGHSDKTAIWFIQRIGLEYNIINYYENRLKKLPHYLEYMQNLKYIYSTCYMPHDADNETLAARSIANQARTAGFKVIVVNRPAKKAVGINAVRTIFELCNFDEENTKDGWQCLSRYAYKVNEETGNFSKEPDHDTPWSHGCFTADTKVLTRDGVKAINTLPENGEVLTLWGWKAFTNPHLTRKNASLVEICFTNGSTVKCTPDHLFLTEKGWKSAESLTRGLLIQSALIAFNTSMKSYIKLINVQGILYVLKLYIEKCGKRLLEKYQIIATYIIGMKLKQTINCLIWNASLKKNILNIQLCGVEKMNFSLMYQKMPENLQKFGISHQKEMLGMFNMQLVYGKNNRKYAKNVGKHSMECHNKNFVVMTVQKHIIKKLELLKLKKHQLGLVTEYVWSAIKNLFMREQEEEKINNFAPKSAGNLIIQSVKALNEKQDVWCLTVPECGHFALENGAIVKNCDAFQTFALSLKTDADVKKLKPKPLGPVSQQIRGWMGNM